MVLTSRPLDDYFERRGIPLRQLAPGQRVPESFSDPVIEHLATRRAAGLFDFSFMACVEIRGQESLMVLHAIQSRNLAQLAVGRIRYTLLLRDEGTVLNDATVWRTSDNAYLVFVGRHTDVPLILQPAGKYHVRCDDRSHRFAVVALQGPRSREILARCLPLPGDLPYFGFAESDFRQRQCLVARLGYTGETGYEIVIGSDSAPELWDTIVKAGAAGGLEECGFAAADTLRIEAGHVLFTNELALPVTPQEIGLERLVDFSRGASAGVRKKSGKAFERRLVGLVFEHGAPPAIPAADDEVIVTSACRSPTLQRWIGLAFVPCDASNPGTRVTIAGTKASVTRLPFYDPGKQRRRGLE
jgi:glycine cleavage system T protein (aminomethyltransferase)